MTLTNDVGSFEQLGPVCYLPSHPKEIKEKSQRILKWRINGNEARHTAPVKVGF